MVNLVQSSRFRTSINSFFDITVSLYQNQNPVTNLSDWRQFCVSLTCIQKYWKVSDEGTLTRYLRVHYTRDVNGGWTVDNSPYITLSKEKFESYPLSDRH